MPGLTEEQQRLLILIGSPDDGSQQHVVVDGERTMQELIDLGLLYRKGPKSVEMTDEGESLFDALTCGE